MLIPRRLAVCAVSLAVLAGCGASQTAPTPVAPPAGPVVMSAQSIGTAASMHLAAARLVNGRLVSDVALAASPDESAHRGGYRARRILALTNEVRAQHGCGPLRPNRLLARTARAHSADMSRRGYFEHDTLNGRTWYKRIWAGGYQGNSLAENIAQGFDSADAVQDAWLHSPEHRRNILDCGLRDIGVGYAADGGYWTVDFGAP